MERMHIARVLQKTGGKKMQAARLLAIDLKTLNKKIRDYHISLPSPADFRSPAPAARVEPTRRNSYPTGETPSSEADSVYRQNSAFGTVGFQSHRRFVIVHGDCLFSGTSLAPRTYQASVR